MDEPFFVVDSIMALILSWRSFSLALIHESVLSNNPIAKPSRLFCCRVYWR